MKVYKLRIQIMYDFSSCGPTIITELPHERKLHTFYSEIPDRFEQELFFNNGKHATQHISGSGSWHDMLRTHLKQCIFHYGTKKNLVDIQKRILTNA